MNVAAQGNEVHELTEPTEGQEAYGAAKETTDLLNDEGDEDAGKI